MPRKSQKSKNKSNSPTSSNTNVLDVTLADFANSQCPSGRGRLKKSAGMSVAALEHEGINVVDNDVAWNEELEDELELKSLTVEDNDVAWDEELEDELEFTTKAPPCRQKTFAECCGFDSEGSEYPLEIWFLISEYIRPEDVATFACICQSTYSVVCTAKFWFSLYKRFYKKGLRLPERLQPDCMVRHYGLRACVIRALYFMYPPFVAKAKRIMGLGDDPHQLTKRRCALVWHEKYENQWLFCFKLRRVDYEIKKKSEKKNTKKPNLMEMLDDVFANSEDGCKVLQVACTNFIPTPMVLGHTLLSVSLTLDNSMRCKLVLGFGSGPRCSVEAGLIPVVLNPVIKVRVLDWWHPFYPHSK